MTSFRYELLDPARELATLVTVVYLLSGFVIMHHLIYPFIVKDLIESSYKGKHKVNQVETLVRQRDFSELAELKGLICQLSISSLIMLKLWK